MVQPANIYDTREPRGLSIFNDPPRAKGSAFTKDKRRRLDLKKWLGGAILALGVLLTGAPAALADHDVYPSGWNKEPDPNVPTPMFDFRSGWGWNDYQRYWPDQALRTSPKSRPLADEPVVYGMTPEGHRFHKAQ